MTDSDDWSLAAMKAYIDECVRTSERALDKAQHALEYRLESMNEFRAQIVSERTELLSKDDYEQRHNALEQRQVVGEDKMELRLSGLERWQAKLVGAMALVIFLTPLLAGAVAWLLANHHGP